MSGKAPSPESGAVQTPLQMQSQNHELVITPASPLIQVTKDRLRLELVQYSAALSKRTRWATPLGLFLTVLTTMVTAEFRDALSISKAEWKAAYLIATIASVIWLIIGIVQACRARASIDGVIRSLHDPS